MESDLAVVDRLIEETRERTGSLIALLEELQKQFHYLPPFALERAAEKLGVSLSSIFGVATFYNAFSLRPRGQHIVRVCMGTACHVAGGHLILEELERLLGVKAGNTTPDGRFSLEIVHCVGSCAVAPVLVTDGEYHGRIDTPRVRSALDRIGEAPELDDEPPAPGGRPADERDAELIRISCREDLERQRAALLARRPSYRISISLCGGPGCRPRGGERVARAIRKAIREQGLGDRIDFRLSGCHGFCEQGPVVVVEPGGVFYAGVKADDAAELVACAARGEVLRRRLYRSPLDGTRIVAERDVPFYQKQHRLLLADHRMIEPTSLDDAIALGAWEGLSRAVTTMTPEQVIDLVAASGLRGRGGAGFATAMKWKFCRAATGSPKVVICNADEGDPGAFMDRAILEGDPHAVLEGMAIGAYAIGAEIGIIYVRDEYPLAVEHLRLAIAAARARGLLGRHLFGGDFSFDIELVRGAGAFVCGEETALIASVEGQRGMPRAKPPFPANAGLHGLPTNINNVKTWKFASLLLRQGHEPFSALGTDGCRGTMLFSLVGKVRNPGLVEVPLGTTIRELVFDVGGGPLDKPIRAVQLGGPSGGCIPAELFDTPLTYEALAAVGGILGSGGVIVLDEGACMVDVARYFVHFTRDESCGKCVPCQMGTQQLARILDRIVAGAGQPGDLDQLKRICRTMQDGSLCGLGKTAPNPVLTTIRYFEDEYRAHIERRCCPAGVCRELVSYWIDPEDCVGCSLCRKVCGASAILGEHKELHTIDAERCVRCGACFDVCPPRVKAVRRTTRDGRPQEVVL